MYLLRAVLCAGGVVLLAAPAVAQLDGGLPVSTEGFAFDAADSDGDGLISEA